MFSKIFAFLASQIAALQQSLEAALAARGAMAFGTGIIFLIFWAYAAWKLFHTWSATAEDSFPRKLHAMFSETGRATLVYVLVLAAPAIVGTIGSVAKAYARRATITMISAATPVFRDVDSVIDDTKPLYGTLAPMLMVNAGGEDLTRRSLIRGAYDAVTTGSEELTSRERELLQTGNAAQSAAIRAFQKGMAAQNAILKAAENSGNKTRIERAKADRQSYLAHADAAMQAASKAGAAIYRPYEDRRQARKQEIWAKMQATWYQEYLVAKSGGAKTHGAEIWENFTEGTDAPVERKKHLDLLTNQAVEAALQAEEQQEKDARGWADDIPRLGGRVMGIAASLICSIGAIAMGVQVFKGVFGTLLYCVNFLAVVTFAVALAMPLSPAFMLCFISEKTEPYGRNFFNFLLSAAFGAMALSLMVGAIAFLLQGLSTSMVSMAATEILKVQIATNDIGGLFLACLCYAGGLTVFGMVATFLADLAKKGIAIGNGLFTGHFPA